jgi:hypothetical protein
MSPQNSKPTPDVWVGLLFVSVAALTTGIVFLVFELNKYDWKVPT